MSRDLHNHFGRRRRDFQLSFGLGDIVVRQLRVTVQRVGERVIALANVRLRARHVVRRAFFSNKALAANRYLVVRQRCAVVDLLARARGQRHIALLDRQLSVGHARNDIFLRRVNLANSTVRKRDRIFSSVLSLPARCGNIVKGDVILRAGIARFNRLLFSIISLLAVLRRQRDVLIIVEIDLVRSRPNRNRLLFIRFRRNCVAFNRGGGCLHLCPERLTVNGLGSRDLLGRPVPVIIHRIAQVGLLRVVEDDLVRSLGDRDRLRGFRYQFIAFNIRCVLRHLFVKRLILLGFLLQNRSSGSSGFINTLHRVAQIVFSGVYNINRQVFVGHLAANNRFIRLIADDRRRNYVVGTSRRYILRIRILFQNIFRNQVYIAYGIIIVVNFQRIWRFYPSIVIIERMGLFVCIKRVGFGCFPFPSQSVNKSTIRNFRRSCV